MRTFFVIFNPFFLVDRTYRPSSAWITLLSQLYVHSSIAPEVQVSFGPETIQRPVATLNNLDHLALPIVRPLVHSSGGPGVLWPRDHPAASGNVEQLGRTVAERGGLPFLSQVTHDAFLQHRLSKSVVGHDSGVLVVLDEERTRHKVASIVSAVGSNGGRSCCWCLSCCRGRCCCRGWCCCGCLSCCWSWEGGARL